MLKECLYKLPLLLELELELELELVLLLEDLALPSGYLDGFLMVSLSELLLLLGLSLGLTLGEDAGKISIPVSEVLCDKRSITDTNFLDIEEDVGFKCSLFLLLLLLPLLEESLESCLRFLLLEELLELLILLLSSSERLLRMFSRLTRSPDPPKGMISIPPDFFDVDDDDAVTTLLVIGVIETEGVMSVTIVGGTNVALDSLLFVKRNSGKRSKVTSHTKVLLDI